MKTLLFTLLVGSAVTSLASPCDNGLARSDAKDALKEFKQSYQGQIDLKSSDLKLAKCSLGWAESMLGKRRPNVSFSIDCGIVAKIENESEQLTFAQEIYDNDLTYIDISGPFATVSIPVCAQ